MVTHLFPPRRHSSEGWNPGGEAGVVMGWQVLPDGTFSCRACCHSRCAGMTGLNHWIPAFAGMTVVNLGIRLSVAGGSEGRQDIKQV